MVAGTEGESVSLLFTTAQRSRSAVQNQAVLIWNDGSRLILRGSMGGVVEGRAQGDARWRGI